MAAEHAMVRMVSNEDLHLRLTPLRSPAIHGMRTTTEVA